MFKSGTQPLCRYCGKLIGKHTESHYFGGRMVGSISHYPRNWAEAQKLVNAKIVAARYSRYDPDGYASTVGTPKHDYVSYVTTWDGESYRDQYFCGQPCAVRFAYLYAKDGHATSAYNKAHQTKQNKAALSALP
jgi:NAD(P)H-flavin reductase